MDRPEMDKELAIMETRVIKNRILSAKIIQPGRDDTTFRQWLNVQESRVSLYRRVLAQYRAWEREIARHVWARG